MHAAGGDVCTCCHKLGNVSDFEGHPCVLPRMSCSHTPQTSPNLCHIGTCKARDCRMQQSWRARDQVRNRAWSVDFKPITLRPPQLNQRLQACSVYSQGRLYRGPHTASSVHGSTHMCRMFFLPFHVSIGQDMKVVSGVLCAATELED